LADNHVTILTAATPDQAGAHGFSARVLLKTQGSIVFLVDEEVATMSFVKGGI
jgi:hypothetical protein